MPSPIGSPEELWWIIKTEKSTTFVFKGCLLIFSTRERGHRFLQSNSSLFAFGNCEIVCLSWAEIVETYSNQCSTVALDWLGPAGGGQQFFDLK